VLGLSSSWGWKLGGKTENPVTPGAGARWRGTQEGTGGSAVAQVPNRTAARFGTRAAVPPLLRIGY